MQWDIDFMKNTQKQINRPIHTQMSQDQSSINFNSNSFTVSMIMTENLWKTLLAALETFKLCTLDYEVKMPYDFNQHPLMQLHAFGKSQSVTEITSPSTDIQANTKHTKCL